MQYFDTQNGHYWLKNVFVRTKLFNAPGAQEHGTILDLTKEMFFGGKHYIDGQEHTGGKDDTSDDEGNKSDTSNDSCLKHGNCGDDGGDDTGDDYYGKSDDDDSDWKDDKPDYTPDDDGL